MPQGQLTPQQRWLGQSPGQLVHQQSSILNPYGSLLNRQNYIEGDWVPRNNVMRLAAQDKIADAIKSQTKKTKKALSDQKKNLGISTFSTILKFLPIPGARVASMAIDAAQMLGARYGGSGPSYTSEQETIAQQQQLLAAGGGFQARDGATQSALQSLGATKITSASEELARANEKAAKQGKMMGLVALGNQIIGAAKGVSDTYQHFTTPQVKPGMEAIAAEQKAAGLNPTQATHTTPAKDFAQWSGTEDMPVMRQMSKAGLRDMPVEGHPGHWGSTEFTAKGPGNQVGTGYMGALKPTRDLVKPDPGGLTGFEDISGIEDIQNPPPSETFTLPTTAGGPGNDSYLYRDAAVNSPLEGMYDNPSVFIQGLNRLGPSMPRRPY